LRYSEISKSKHPARRTAGKQIPIKSQMSISNAPNRFDILNFGHCDLFVICDLRFGIFHRNLNVSSSIKLEAAARDSAQEELLIS
jgi:hypothetical protein